MARQIKVVEVIEITCDFCGLGTENPVPVDVGIGEQAGTFEICEECGYIFQDRFFTHDAILPDQQDEEEVEEEDEFELEDIEDVDEEDEFADEYDIEDEEEELEHGRDEDGVPLPPPPPKNVRVTKGAGAPPKRKKVVRKKAPAKKKVTAKRVSKKKVAKRRYKADVLKGIDVEGKDGSVIGADGTVSEGKVLRQLKRVAASEQRGVIKRCPHEECEHDPDTGKCDKCGLKANETGMAEGAQGAFDPIRAESEGQKGMGYDPFMQAHTFPVDVNSDKVQRRMIRNRDLNNRAVRKKFGSSGRYFNLDPTDGSGRGR